MPSLWSQDTYRRTFLIAARAHQGQLYPGTQIPYIMHLSLVSMEVIAALQVEHPRCGDLAVQCALLHDTIEDTSTTVAELAVEFTEDVIQGVLALTKNVAIDKSLQMKDSLQRILQQPPEVGMVKLADRVSNLGQPPSHWTKEKVRAYRLEARQIYETLHASSPFLANRLLQKIEAYGRYV